MHKRVRTGWLVSAAVAVLLPVTVPLADVGATPPAGSGGSSITADLRSYNFGQVGPGAYVNGPAVTLSSTSTDTVTLTTNFPQPNPPFVRSFDGCSGLTVNYVQQGICLIIVDFNNVSGELSPGHYRTTLTVSNASGQVLVRVRYSGTV